ncbi:thioester reductase domain-containing protein [Mycobacterium lepromatosis]|uniref:Peptide synthase n=1 Tax=Mycobacterium lepromatosis TaxID=480418 RepID=A0A0F4EQF2_9MYCO|nr:thioester reductase domain-containing protein [Mycobacterium lepromatosis]KJX74827.1 peptide synthase [Mycobacterium lepromatosis]UKN43085.1 peptide synthase [Mycobacterium lepromatosis]
MTAPNTPRVDRVPLSRSQQNIYNGVLQDNDPALYFIGKSYRFHQLELSGFLAALEATILKNPLQLCVLESPSTEGDYPDLVPRLQFGDIVRVRSDEQSRTDRRDYDLMRAWSPDILAKPLVRYTVRTDESGFVARLDVFTHHILFDGGAIRIIEADLAHHLDTDNRVEIPGIRQALAKLAEAHRREATRVEESLQRLANVVQRELAEEVRNGGYSQVSNDASGTAALGVLYESILLFGKAFDEIIALSEAKKIPLNILVAAATVAVDASLRQSTETLLVHTVDNRFGEPNLDVATCLVNSVAHSIRFPPFASVQDVVRTLDRSYVKAIRLRWLREEQYRRMYLALNQTRHLEALTLNFIREPCAPGLRRFLLEVPTVTDIGPVEGMTVACVLDKDERTLELSIWNRVDLPQGKSCTRVAKRIAAALELMVAAWDQPIAMIVNEWFGISSDGARCLGNEVTQTTQPIAPAWFLDPGGSVHLAVDRRRYVHPWVARLVRDNVLPGDVLVFTDDNTDKTIDLLIACHLAGCGYSVCDTLDEVPLRAKAITDHGGGVSARVINVAATHLEVDLDDEQRRFAEKRIKQAKQDISLADKTAYIMPTSGSTGQPKLVQISHGSLALFCDAVRNAYGWGTHDTILQCAPLTSDISVEEIFGGAICGSTLVRSTAMKMGDLAELARDLFVQRATVIDLPTAVWHLLCDNSDAIDEISRSCLRQIVIGGEAVRSCAVDKWIDSFASQGISLVSTYGPTETTVVVTYLPLVCAPMTVASDTRLRLGRPIVPNTVFIAFGELVIVGDLVSVGYLGIDSRNFGTVTTTDGSCRRAFATADCVILDDEGFPVFSGRKDSVVKISGKRVDTAELIRRISADPTVSDIAVEVYNGRLGVWLETKRTREGADDAAAETRSRLILTSLGVSSFFVVGVPCIPRKSNGKIDRDNLLTMPQLVDSVRNSAGSGEGAAGLAEIWSRYLGRAIRPDSSLLDEGIGSVDLIRILPDTRKHLGRHLSLLDLISADTAANLTAAQTANGWMDVGTAAEIERDLASLCRQRNATEFSVKQPRNSSQKRAIIVLGASGILGTGFAQAVLDLRRSGVLYPEVVLATRARLPEDDPWTALQGVEGVRIEHISYESGPAELEVLIRDTDAGTLVNGVGNTNMLVPYRELRLANIELVSTIVETCARHNTRLVHLSSFVVNADVTVPRVTDPRETPYPYAASKSLAELVVAGSPPALDFTIVRLPRVLGENYQLRNSADILLSIVDACIALRAYPATSVMEEVTTGRAAAKAILGVVPALTRSEELGRGISVVRGEAVAYTDFVSEFASDELDMAEWKYRLDQSDWAKRNPRRWSVIDAWFTLGMMFEMRSYADYPTMALGIESVAELAAPPESIRALIAHECSQPLKYADR